MDTKILSNEYKIDIEKYGTLVYGSPNENCCDVIEIIMKGRFTPTEDKKDYSSDLKNVKNRFIEIANFVIKSFEWFDNHYIFAIDFTESGIKYGKSTKFKYKLFVKPKRQKEITRYEKQIIRTINKLNGKLKKIFKRYGFIIT